MSKKFFDIDKLFNIIPEREKQIRNFYKTFADPENAIKRNIHYERFAKNNLKLQKIIKKNNLFNLVSWGIDDRDRTQYMNSGFNSILENLKTQQFFQNQKNEEKENKKQSNNIKLYLKEKSKQEQKEKKDRNTLFRYSTIGNTLGFEKYIQDKDPSLSKEAINSLRIKTIRKAVDKGDYEKLKLTRQQHPEFDKPTKARYDVYARYAERNFNNINGNNDGDNENKKIERHLGKIEKFLVGGVLLKGLRGLVTNKNALWLEKAEGNSLFNSFKNVGEQGLKGFFSLFTTGKEMIQEKANWKSSQADFALTGVSNKSGLLSLVGANMIDSEAEVVKKIKNKFGNDKLAATAYADRVGLGHHFRESNETKTEKLLGGIFNLLKEIGIIVAAIGGTKILKNAIGGGSSAIGTAKGTAIGTSAIGAIGGVAGLTAITGAGLSAYGNKKQGEEIVKAIEDEDYIDDDITGIPYKPDYSRIKNKNNNIDNLSLSPNSNQTSFNNSKNTNNTNNIVNNFNIHMEVKDDEINDKYTRKMKELFEELKQQDFMKMH